VPASTFILQGDRGLGLSISVNIPADSFDDDIFFHVSASANQSWVGFGFGTQMLDALIFVAYQSNHGENVTLSPRIGLFHTEPQYTHAVGIEVLKGSYVDDETYNINARCTSCRSWPLPSGARGEISVASTAQPMLYAFGGENSFLQTDSPEAKIQPHHAYGMFKMNLQTANGKAGVPDHPTTDSHITRGKATIESQLMTITHGLIMAICFVVLFPTGALLTRLPFRMAFWLHLICQCSTTLCVLGGITLGIYNCIHSNKYPALNTPHQVFGLTITLLLLIQPTLGFRGFLLNRHHQQNNPRSHHTNPALAGKLHRYLGPTIILAGIINGALGLVLVNNSDKLPAYAAACIFVAIVYLVSFCIFRRRTISNSHLVVPAVHLTPPSRSVPLKSCAALGSVSVQSSISQQSTHSQHGSGLSSEQSLAGVVVGGMERVEVEEHTSMPFLCVDTKDGERRMEC
jgi:Cytochrome domain of cellobiose dehydrogenase/Eukaryotic cytochrome b561